MQETFDTTHVAQHQPPAVNTLCRKNETHNFNETGSEFTIECIDGEWIRVQTVYLDFTPAEFAVILGQRIMAAIADGSVDGAYDQAFAWPTLRLFYCTSATGLSFSSWARCVWSAFRRYTYV